ncbi:MAG TPA: ribonuclease H-like domain-containing protein [Acidimicrobiales bacterium]|nr:ribonuclease H-like domain-containing protein [Acidimicrobiales bacterium]
MSDIVDSGTAPGGVDRYAPRWDVSRVPAQGGYVAKRCPLRVEFDLIPPVEAPLPESVMARARMDEGVAFEAAVFADLCATNPAALHLDDGVPGDVRLAATVQAMADGVELILGGRLPVDEVGRRTGKPDVLVRAGTRPDGAAAYVPIDVKHHKTLDPRERDRQVPGLVSALADPSLSAAKSDMAWVVKSLRGDALQLAHYHRMLEACGHGADAAWGGIIGKERRVAWIDLGAPRFRATWKGHDTETTLERYDFEFAFRLDVLAAALGGDHIVEPVQVGECDSCPWYSHCGPRLREIDSVSLLPLHGYVEWQTHRRAGIGSRRDLARLDRRTALLRDDLPPTTDVTGMVDVVGSVSPDTPITDLVGDDSKELAVLVDHDVTTARDVLALDQRALSMHNRMVGGSLARAIDVARVAVFGDGVLHRRRGVATVAVPAGDVEVDIDMENTLDGTTYLWGALVDSVYVPVVEWGPPTELLEARLFARFWDWVQQKRRAAHDSGRRIVFYCWSASAERGALTSGAALAEAHLGAVGAREEVASFVDGDEFVDLLDVLRTQLESGAGNGLKTIAPRAGFSWRDDEPAGDLSMLWHRAAVDGAGDGVSAARKRLLDYNEDDVRATAAVRRWLRSTNFPAIEDLDEIVQSVNGRR